MAAKTEIVQVVSATGEFDDGLDAFIQRSAGKADTAYQVVAITGPQSSGKSTLMNILFGTNFEEMDAIDGRRQTTQGIWLAKSSKLSNPTTLVMDLEGSDGRERGEDDNSFERQSSLFALAVADVLVVNMWAKDVGREAGAGKPLLKTIFQVNLKLFAPDPNKERTVLLFVFRDRTKTPLARLVQTWEEDLQQMWASVTKPPQYEGTGFPDFFEVKYASLPNFEDKEEEFRAESVLLRRRFTEEDEDTLVRRSRDKLPGHALSLSLKNIWEVIKDQRDLNLPAHKVMVAKVRCEEIATEKLEELRGNEAWRLLEEKSASALNPSFGSQASVLINACRSGYDEEARYFEAGVRSSQQAELVSSAHRELRPAFDNQLRLVQRACLELVKQGLSHPESGGAQFSVLAARAREASYDEFHRWVQRLAVDGAAWDTQPAYKELQSEIDSHIDRLVTSKIAEAVGDAEDRLSKLILGPASSLLDTCPRDLWPRLDRLLSNALPKCTQALLASLQGYGLEQGRILGLQQRLEQFGSARILAHVKEAANTALSRMKDRFSEVFMRDEQAMPRRWGPRDNITAVMHKAYRESAQLLAQLVAFRLGMPQDLLASVEASIQLLAGDLAGLKPEEASKYAAQVGDFDIQSASEWPGIDEERLLLSPSKCRQLWRQFSSDSNYIVQQAQATQEANRAANNRMPPLWALAAIAVLGLNEFLAVLYNPVWLLLLIVVLLFGKTVYAELEVDAELQNGLLPGLLALSNKFVPTVKQVSQRTFQQLVRVAQDPGQLTAERPVASEHMGNEAPSDSGSTASTAISDSRANGLRHRSQPPGETKDTS